MKNQSSKCLFCSEVFKFDPSQSKGMYCSKSCRYKDHSSIIKGSYTTELKERKSQKMKKIWDERKQDPDFHIKFSTLFGGAKHTQTKEWKDNLSKKMIRNDFTIVCRTVLDKYGPFCQRCGLEIPSGKKKIAFHHKDGRQWVNTEENIQILCSSCHGKLHNELSKVAGKFAGLATVENYIARTLLSLGVDLKQPDFIDTPSRVARMYNELFEGVRPESQKELGEIFKSKFPSHNESMVIVRNMRIYSLCPHHLLPVSYDISVGYIPNKWVLGLSKFVRISELLGRKPVLQETLTVDIAEVIQRELNPKGVICTVSGQHYCMMMRGVKQQDSSVLTSHITEIFRKDSSAKTEFLSLIEKRG